MRFLILSFLMILSIACSQEKSASTEDDTMADTPAYIVKPGKRIALTFDDIPRDDSIYMTGKARSDAIIAALEKAEIRATFFVNTQPLATNTDNRLERYQEAGHSLANHTHTHAMLSKLSDDKYLEEIDKTSAILKDYDQYRKWFRYTFLDEGKDIAQRDAMRSALKERGYLNAYITVDHADWHINTVFNNAIKKGYDVNIPALKNLYVELGIASAEHYHNLAIETYGRPVAQVFLLHENDIAALYLGDLIAGLRKKGWEIISPEEAYLDPIIDMHPDTLQLSQGRVGAQAIANEQDPQTVYFPPRQPSYINQKFIDYEVLSATEMADLSKE